MESDKHLIFEVPNLKKGVFLTRPNRFVAEIEYKGKIEKAHVHDPGRLKELLIKGADILFTNSRGKWMDISWYSTTFENCWENFQLFTWILECEGNKKGSKTRKKSNWFCGWWGTFRSKRCNSCKR